MQCRELRDLADSFISGQLLVETNHEIVRHLETCPDCRGDIAARRTLRERLQSAFSRAESLNPRPAFAAELAERLRQSSSVSEISRRSLLKSWWAMAAGVLAAVSGGLLARRVGRTFESQSQVAALAGQAVGDHQNCAVKFGLDERPVSLAVAAERYGGPYAALATFNPPAAADGPVEVLERHACVYNGRRFGHVVLRHLGGIASLLVSDGAAPSRIQLEPDVDGFRIAAFPAGRYAGFIVSNLDRNQTMRLAQAIGEPLDRHLRS